MLLYAHNSKDFLLFSVYSKSSLLSNNFLEGDDMKQNGIVREAALRKGVYLWEIARELGVTDGTFSRKLRKELPPEETQKILEIIDRLAGGVE